MLQIEMQTNFLSLQENECGKLQAYQYAADT